jgi:hypothetical protein
VGIGVRVGVDACTGARVRVGVGVSVGKTVVKTTASGHPIPAHIEGAA